ncbi:hypothetical protein GCM10009801_12410 [Streptomyces albiaxialis]|uniref:Transglycosylase SLT domain-containing protein n=1 Tax=Streptomyces albiaxialis TaxID=329523 RepID=A0ABN2VMI8_9ACTN
MGAGGSGGKTDTAEKGRNSAIMIGAVAGGGFFGCFVPLIVLLLLVGVVIVCALGVIFWPLVLICKIFGCPSGGGGGDDTGDKVSEAYYSDGKGELNEASVPADYLEAIKDAGEECPQIGPIVIAAQIQQASGFNKDLIGPKGKKGISQLPPDKFEEYGEDDDDNDETSALDAEDSIMAQARYMCALAKDIEEMAKNNEVTGDRLDMTLAAYSLGSLDAVKKARGVPKDRDAKGYIVAVRSGFSLYSGAVKPPDGQPYPTPSPFPTSSSPGPGDDG